MSFSGLRVIAFESRRAVEMARLIANQGGEPFVAPSLREVPESREETFRFAERLFAGAFDMMIFLTGVGTRLLAKTLATRYPAAQFPEALRRLTVVARGPKPVTALRDFQVPVTITAREPNTWREVLASIEGRPERRVAVQEYGRPNTELLEALAAGGREVTPVRVYGWDLPQDTEPLREAVARLAAGRADVVLFTTAMQVVHLFRVAAESGLEAAARENLQRAVAASIGPATTEALEEYGVRPDLEPSHPRMGFLVQEAADQAAAILARKSVRR